MVLMNQDLPDELSAPEGWAPYVLCAALYLASSRSLGRWSLTHELLFTNLAVVSPTRDSVAKIAGGGGSGELDTSSSSKTVTRRNTTPSVPLPVPHRLGALELSQKGLEPGELTRHAMQDETSTSSGSSSARAPNSTTSSFRYSLQRTTNRKPMLQMWKRLDASVCFCTTCALVVAIRYVSGVIRVVRTPGCFTNAADNGASCWDTMFQPKSSMLLSLFLVLSLRHWYKLSMLCSHTPGFSVWLLPNSVVPASLLAVLTHTLMGPGTKGDWTNLGGTEAMQELAARVVLWWRLIGIGPGPQVDDTVWLEVVYNVLRRVAGGVAFLVGIAVAEPMRTTQYAIAFRYHASDMVHHVLPYHTWCWSSKRARQYFDSLAAAVFFVGPFSILLSYTPFLYAPGVAQQVRAYSCWILLLVTVRQLKSWQQDYLIEPVPLIARRLQRPDAPMHDDDLTHSITSPLSSQTKFLLQHGARLVCLPLLMIILLSAGYLSHAVQEVYSSAYGGSLVNQDSGQLWRQREIARLGFIGKDYHTTNVLRYLSTTSLDVCGESMHLELLSRPPQGINEELRHIQTSMDLLKETTPPKLALIDLVKDIQMYAAKSDAFRKALLGETFATKTTRHAANRVQKMHDTLDETGKLMKAIVLHPVFTSRVLLMWVNLLGLLICVYWCLTFPANFWAHRREIQTLRAHGKQYALARKKRS